MRITRATTFIVVTPWQNRLFVRVDTDQPGLYGVGEGTLNAFVTNCQSDGTLPAINCLQAPVGDHDRMERLTELRSLVRE